ncbi:hypothetical protein GGX14DRAFT_605978 [Mycena pura]|uniref:Uncharacterized protein n=1 Tax=Mycena pura TaxID=153505 RepID=A0AAD6Y3V7_9AGAR|nr:hypothetical protein GGX14DRAFT_605978 [Mycena pura]
MSGEVPPAPAALLSIRLSLLWALMMLHWDHRLTFLIEHQTTVSFYTAVVSQSLGTIYCAVLVFLTQKLAMQRTTELMTLTAMHDNISVWAGLGSALSTLFNQVSVPASVLGTLSIVVYLGCISTLHISIPAMLSVDAFNASASVAIPASTSGMPEYANSSVIKCIKCSPENSELILYASATRKYMITFPAELLPWRGIFDESQTLGLSNGSLYEVLDATTSGNDKAQVSAIGFNITCGYLSAVIESAEYISGVHNEPMVAINLLVDGNSVSTGPGYPHPNTVYTAGSTNSLFILTTIPISDSEGHQSSPILLDQHSHPSMTVLTQLNLNISQLQLIRCSKSLVAQTGLISAQSDTIINGSLYPDIHKTQSTWISGLELDIISQDSSLLGDDLWSAMFGDSVFFDSSPLEEYLMSYLGLDPFANTSAPALQLHDIENALSNLVAMLFWTAEDTQPFRGGHVTVDQWYTTYLISMNAFTGAGIPPKIGAGNATIIQQETLQIRLNAKLLRSRVHEPELELKPGFSAQCRRAGAAICQWTDPTISN